jgi:hypothetical protein
VIAIALIIVVAAVIWEIAIELDRDFEREWAELEAELEEAWKEEPEDDGDCPVQVVEMEAYKAGRSRRPKGQTGRRHPKEQRRRMEQ